MRGLADFFLLRFDWFALGLAGACVLFCAAAALGPWGRLRLGGADARPEFSTLSWLAMLFAAGMGAGLVFWGAAEPLIFTVNPPPGGAEPGSLEARRDAFALTLFHWGLHPWAIYAAAALAVAYVADEKRPFAPSSVFSGASARVRRLIDWAAAAAVIFGVVASVGQGAIQMGAGLRRLTGVGLEAPLAAQAGVIAVLALVYLASAAGGLKRGIEPLSNFNLALSFALLVFVFTVGPTLEVVRTLMESAGAYLAQIGPLSVDLRPEGVGRSWTRDWSLTYFLWWVAWTPFVGVFIARISRGRTVREFILGVVLAPTVLSWVWFSAFGGAAIDAQMQAGVDLGVDDFATAPSAAYVLLETLIYPAVTGGLTLLLVAVFIITSADSGSYVLAMLSSGGKARPGVGERLFWGVLIAALSIAAVLSGGGQNATRAFAVVGAIPLSVLLAAQMGALGLRLVRDGRGLARRGRPS